MDECSGLENRRGATHRGFESHPLRHASRRASATDVPCLIDRVMTRSQWWAPSRSPASTPEGSRRPRSDQFVQVFCRVRRASVVEYCQVELAQALGVGYEVDFEDLPELDREAEDDTRPSAWSPDGSHRSVHERRLGSAGAPRGPMATAAAPRTSLAAPHPRLRGRLGPRPQGRAPRAPRRSRRRARQLRRRLPLLAGG